MFNCVQSWTLIWIWHSCIFTDDPLFKVRPQLRVMGDNALQMLLIFLYEGVRSSEKSVWEVERFFFEFCENKYLAPYFTSFYSRFRNLKFSDLMISRSQADSRKSFYGFKKWHKSAQPSGTSCLVFFELWWPLKLQDGAHGCFFCENRRFCT